MLTSQLDRFLEKSYWQDAFSRNKYQVTVYTNIASLDQQFLLKI